MRPLATQFVEVIDRHGFDVLHERGAPVGRLKRDCISLVSPDGRSISLSNLSGFASNSVHVPPEAFDDLCAARFLAANDPEDGEGRTFYHLTDEGRAAARG